MINHEAEEAMAEILVQRIEKGNADILTQIGKSLRSISTLSPSQARQLQQILRFGGDYNKIVRILAKISGKNVEDIYKIFKNVAKENKEFAKKFYEYRNVGYIPYEQDIALKRQVEAMANITAELYKNISQTTGVGLMVGGQYRDLKIGYAELIDRAITTVVEGKEDYYKAMRKTLKEVGRNGVVVYESGYRRRLDSAARMNILDGIRMVNNETDRIYAEQYGSDGVEITVHENPAIDHEDVQGKQFTNEEYNNLQETGIGRTIENEEIDIHNGIHYRPISQLNCMHRPMRIVIGVSQPIYSKKELADIKKRNHEGFEYEGRHYTMYKGTQLQRQIETEIRRQKDTQILAKAAGDTELVRESQDKITKLTHKYDELCQISGLKSQKQRMTVSGYRRTKVSSPKEQINSKLEKFRNMNDQELNQLGSKLFSQKSSDIFAEGLNGSSDYQKLIRELDLNDKPTVLASKEFEKQAKNEEIIYRGLKDIEKYDGQKYVIDKSGADIINNLKYSDKTYIGIGIYGDGIYFTNSYKASSKYAEFKENNIAAAFIDKTKANIIEVNELKQLREQFYSQHPEINKHGLFQELSNFAMYKGYNVIKVKEKETGGNGDYYNILNRNVLIMRGN